MAFTKPNIIATTLLTPELFNTLETQYDEVISYWGTNPFRMENEPIAVELVTSDPAHSDGKIIYNSTDGKLKVSFNSAWIDLSEFAEVV